AGSDVYNFVPKEKLQTENAIYELVSSDVQNGDYVAFYEMVNTISENLIYNGDMSETTTDGTYTYVTGWQGGYVNRVHNPLSDRPYLYESGAWQSTADAHFIYTPATEDEMAYVTTPKVDTMPNPGYGDSTYPWKSDVSEPYMGLVLTSWMKDASDADSYLKAEKGKTYLMSFEMKATEINTNSWVNNVVGFDAVTVNGDAYENQLPGTNGDINTLTSVLDTHIGRNKYLDTANEWVTIETTATALNDGYFMFQLGWAHEWGQVSVRNFNIREVGEPVTIKVGTKLEGSTLTVSVEDVEDSCVIAVSLNDGETVSTKAYDGNPDYTFDVATADKVVVYVWKSITSMTPLVEKIQVK
ncbi:MAG: hypothetical protein IJ297_04960, partial [Clostridia bacterium]|nr:hypothetical protein [Clostridia bacterium]